MTKNSIIQHAGTVKFINGSTIGVEIISQTACGSCHAKSHCMMAELEHKIVDISDDCGQYEVGDSVTVILEESKGLKALAFGYLIPFAVVFLALIGSMAVFQNEVIAGLISVGILAVYYGSLYFLRDRLKESFQMTLQKQ